MRRRRLTDRSRCRKRRCGSRNACRGRSGILFGRWFRLKHLERRDCLRATLQRVGNDVNHPRLAPDRINRVHKGNGEPSFAIRCRNRHRRLDRFLIGCLFEIDIDRFIGGPACARDENRVTRRAGNRRNRNGGRAASTGRAAILRLDRCNNTPTQYPHTDQQQHCRQPAC